MLPDSDGSLPLSSLQRVEDHQVMDIAKKDKNKAKRTKPSTGMERVREIEAEGEFILTGTKAEVVATASFTHNRSLIRKRHNKTPYELLHDKKPYLTYFHVFGALCYPTNDIEDLGNLKPKVDIGIFIGYSLAKKAYRIYNKRTCLIMETIHVEFDELTMMASEQFDSGPDLQIMTLRTISSGPVQNSSSSTPYVPPTKKD
ncbi:retrovirus-related pol polyprotein from transposon TNT 1-94 [Tanacetum coccineum]